MSFKEDINISLEIKNGWVNLNRLSYTENNIPITKSFTYPYDKLNEIEKCFIDNIISMSKDLTSDNEDN